MFHNWPWTNLHEINMDWVVQTVKEWHDKYGSVDDAIGLALQQVEQARSDSLSAIDSARETSLSAIEAARQLSLNAIGNLQTAVMEAIFAAGNGKVDQITAKGDEYLQSLEAMRDVLESAVEAKGEQVLATIPSNYTELYNQVQGNTQKLNEKSPAIQEALFADLVHFTDGAANYPFDSLRSFVEALQEGTGTPSPSNIRAIRGWAEANLMKAAKNLIPFPYENGTKTTAGITFTLNDDGTITANGTATANAAFHITTNTYYPAGAYTVNGGVNPNARLVVNRYRPDGAEISGAADIGYGGVPFNLAETTKVHIYLVIIEGTTVNNVVFRPQIERGTVATEYNKTRYEKSIAQFAQTVYGGEYDWKTGKLTKKAEMRTLTGNSDFTWNSAGVIIVYTDYSMPVTGAGLLCSHYGAGGYVPGSPDNYIYPVNATGLSLRDNVHFATAESAAGYLQAQYAAGTPVQIVYQRAAPEQIQLTPEEIDSFYGENNVWSNTGKTSAFYIADTRLYINNRISALMAMNM